ncbi:hypothetical protein J2T56_001133 [Natronobacillus azotifigens]|uniref:Uncharacterized protein n=1 Tax=Natronobacillus azotifigens TaxID=472978 RepID=A0A9J6RCE3_9BACI|nr:hypothetical protein [Natronobacillus azotifigens]MCZ0702972.1 hypothetical protein [Natronobacillus azotifigens]
MDKKNTKLKISTIVLFILLLILQPSLVRRLHNNGYKMLEVIWLFYISSYYLFGIAVLITDLVTKWIIVKILNGEEIKNRIEGYANMGLIIVSLALYHTWLYDAMTGNYNLLDLLLACVLITCFIILKDKTLIIHDDNMFFGYKTINMNSLSEYKLTEFNSMGVRRDKIELSLNDGKTKLC